MEGVNKGLHELLEKRKALYNEQLEQEWEETHQVKVCLNIEMGKIVERHLKETKFWAEMKNHYEEVATAYKPEIASLKNTLQIA